MRTTSITIAREIIALRAMQSPTITPFTSLHTGVIGLEEVGAIVKSTSGPDFMGTADYQLYAFIPTGAGGKLEPDQVRYVLLNVGDSEDLIRENFPTKGYTASNSIVDAAGDQVIDEAAENPKRGELPLTLARANAFAKQDLEIVRHASKRVPVDYLVPPLPRPGTVNPPVQAD
jgi:hypothetical protein